MAKKKTKKKRSKGKNKGSKFERRFCKELSLWWSDGEREDVFWRTQTSGARATQRTKDNKKTYGQYGDVQAVDPIGKPFMDLFTIELKRGYSGDTIQDLLDKPRIEPYKPSKMEGFIEQAISSAEQAKTPSWMLVVKRDRRDVVIIIPRRSKYGDTCRRIREHVRPFMELRYFRCCGEECRVIALTWNEFREYNPSVFI